MTKAQLKIKKPVKLKVRAGDNVMIISGKDKGEIGFVYAVDPEKQKALVLKQNDENPDQPLPLNAVVKNRKAKRQGEKSARYKMPAPIHVSNLMLLDPKTNEPTRVGRRKEEDKDGKVKLVRYAKKSGEVIKENKVTE